MLRYNTNIHSILSAIANSITFGTSSSIMTSALCHGEYTLYLSEIIKQRQQNSFGWHVNAVNIYDFRNASSHSIVVQVNAMKLAVREKYK